MGACNIYKLRGRIQVKKMKSLKNRQGKRDEDNEIAKNKNKHVNSL